MKIPDNNIISKKSVKNQKEADDKPYFENTHPIFTPEWIDYKQPMKAKEEQEEEEEEKNAPKGKSLLKKIYGGACWKGYEQYGMKIKNGRKVPNCIPTISQNQLREKGGCNGVKTCKVSCPKIADRAVGKYQEVISHLEEHLKEKAEDPKDAKQSKELKKEVLKLNETHLTPANKIPKKDHLYKISNPKMVQQKAKKLYGKDAVIYKSSKPNKKYQILNPKGKWVHFGQMKPPMEDFTFHQDELRRNSYLARATGIKGKWKEDHYSPNYLSLLLLW
jgi:hypothetical protein